ncbi:MAG: DUF1648 domain-containing protein [Candidatus Limivicinus sp.]|nr:DUF1648 domain-containing protein [Candidatus Limivicinus sp.]
MKKNSISILLVIAAIGLGVISWLLLPDVVAVQVGFDGQITNTMPKVPAVAIPLGVSLVGSVMNLTGQKDKKGYILSVAGIAVMVLSLLFNL